MGICRFKLGIDRLSAGPIIGTDIRHFDAYRHLPIFLINHSKQCSKNLINSIQSGFAGKHILLLQLRNALSNCVTTEPLEPQALR